MVISHYATPETPFQFTFGTDAMIPAEAMEPIPRKILFDDEDNVPNLLINLDLLKEHRTLANVKEEACKRRAIQKYNT